MFLTLSRIFAIAIRGKNFHIQRFSFPSFGKDCDRLSEPPSWRFEGKTMNHNSGRRTYMEFVVFQYMLIVLAQLLTVDSSTVCRHTRNTRVTKDVETMVTTTADDGLAPSLRHPYSANNHRARTARHSTRCTFARDLVAVVRNHLLLSPLPSHLHHIHTPLWQLRTPPPPADPGRR